ncbi:MAG: hypothetical protein KatS3mg105_3905 [Gemmatales bacterium]|nr:MAG: hypothetical protein KatS3mg105_3905 [Gemmatales bacterium]
MSGKNMANIASRRSEPSERWQLEQAVRDVGRVLNVPLARVDQIAKMDPDSAVALRSMMRIAQNADLKREYDNDPQIRELIGHRPQTGRNESKRGDSCRRCGHCQWSLDRLCAASARHAQKRFGGRAAKAIPRLTNRDSDDRNPSAKRPITTTVGDGGSREGRHVEDGFSRLANADRARSCGEADRKKRVVSEWNSTRFPSTIRKLSLFCSAAMPKVCFSSNRTGYANCFKRMKPDNIRDLIATNALYRPGPLGGGMVDAYVNRKHGREENRIFITRSWRKILGETYGVMVFQEQVMQILNRLGGIELSSAYACIKAISRREEAGNHRPASRRSSSPVPKSAVSTRRQHAKSST